MDGLGPQQYFISIVIAEFIHVLTGEYIEDAIDQDLHRRKQRGIADDLELEECILLESIFINQINSTTFVPGTVLSS